jgi:Na+/melibiose symporter-like transporter
MDQAIGAALAGFVITMINFPAKAVPGQVPADVMFNLALWDGILASIPGLIAIVFYAQYRIDRNSYEATKLALTEHRAKARAAVVAEQQGRIQGGSPQPAE